MRVRVSLAQINPKSGDLKGNARLILRALERARRRGCDILALPEMALTGYCLDEKLLRNRTFLAENKRFILEELAPACDDIAVIVGFIDYDSQRTGPDGCWIRHNAAAVVQAGRIQGIVHKRLLPSYRYFDDKRYFEAGAEALPVMVQTSCGEVSLGILICEDIWDEEASWRPSVALRESGADLLVAINASPFVASAPGRRDGKRFVRRRIVERMVRDTGLPVVYVNTVGAGDNGKNLLIFDGMSFALDAEGRLVLSLDAFRPDQRSLLLESSRAGPLPEPPFDREEEIFQALVLGIADYCAKIGAFEHVLEPVSGGIDSALGTALAYEAVGGERLRLYNLPSRHNSARTRRLAECLAANFGLAYRTLPIEDLASRAARLFEEHLHPINKGVTRENLQARLRGLLMMMEANDVNGLLLSNGNATEIALGYATLYGDMAGGLSPLGDLTKPDVYRLSSYLNRRWGRDMIPQGIIDAVPSAELAPDQRDPFEYDVTGPMVEDFVERGYSPSGLLERFRSGQLDPAYYPADIYRRFDEESFRRLAVELFGLLNRSVYKRLQGPPIIAVTERAFGFDLRETLINGWRDQGKIAQGEAEAQEGSETSAGEVKSL